MAKELPQIQFDFSDEPQKEFLSGQPVMPVTPPQKGKRGRKPLKQVETLDDTPEVPDDEELFKKAYYSIREVAQMFKVPVAQIRYWDVEFDAIEPRKNRKGDRHFRPQDIKTIQLIHDLIRRRKFTIEGAREYLKKNAKAKDAHELIASLQKIRTFLLELKANL